MKEKVRDIVKRTVSVFVASLGLALACKARGD
jgi:hypothetical protein